ncbi:sulfurtransferase TusA family protein [Curvivirga aplysinae]|uniref:sulfurtransferase TusA family protein n=1 Tax=Curvivirga aplysinae TaxID=2529852 RepID=UPI0012BC7245|nr:sulfurtransferase TusA family protein [Curvivirga aplysinae]MTI08341.1 sulfurtransferase TusA family protein [Curvivirga aplysinae]
MSEEIMDLTGMRCPIPVLKARKRIKTLEAGAKVIIHATDPGAERDFPAFCESQGHKLLSSRWDGDTLILEIEKG